MKFLQIDTFYPQYVKRIYEERPELAEAPFVRQIDALLGGGFSLAHNIAPMMGRHGYEWHYVVPNAGPAQQQWLREAGQTLSDPERAFAEIVRRQIDTIRPDVLYVGASVSFDGRFLRSLTWRPRLVVGWHAAPVPEGTDFSGYDVVVSSHGGCREMALRLGAAAAEPFTPSLPSNVANVVAGEPQSFDVVFAGQVGNLHRKRIDCLTRLVQLPEVREGRWRLGLYLSGGDQIPELAPHTQTPVWGTDMYRALKRGRIALNVHIDMAGGQAQNMRVYETTAVGAFLLTDHTRGLPAPFEPGREMECFETPEEMVEKIRYYLSHDAEREAIARAGYERWLREHSMEVRAAQLDLLIRRHMVR